jgi:hypothetical protein
MDLGQGQLVENNRFTSISSLNWFEKGPTVFEKIGGLSHQTSTLIIIAS